MRNKLCKRVAIMLAVAIAILPIASLAAPTPTAPATASATPTASIERKPTTSMTRSEKIIKDLLDEEETQKQQELFASLVMPRLKYATVRSLSGKTDNWLAFVDILQLYRNGKPQGGRIQQATVQYGVYSKPPYPVACSLSIGEYTSTIEESSQAIYIFDNENLSQDNLSGDVSLKLTASDGKITTVVLNENLPGQIADMEAAMDQMALAYVDYALDSEKINLIDHVYMRLRSHVTNTRSMTMNYSWELFLVHDSKLPAQATLLRYNLQSDKVTVSKVSVKN